MSLDQLSKITTGLSHEPRLNRADIDLNRTLREIHRHFGSDLAAFFEAAREGQTKKKHSVSDAGRLRRVPGSDKRR